MQVVHLHRTHDSDAAALYTANCMQLHAGNITCDWERYVTPGPPSVADDSTSDQVSAAGMLGLLRVFDA